MRVRSRYSCDMTTGTMSPRAVFAVTPLAPLLDRAGVEAARLVHVARTALVTERPSVTYQLLARARDQKEATVRQWVRRLRAAGTLVTVEYDATTLIPSFQFDVAYEPIPQIGRIVAQLTGIGMSGWAVWRWFCAVNPRIGERPVDLVVGGRSDEVEQLARMFVEDGNFG